MGRSKNRRTRISHTNQRLRSVTAEAHTPAPVGYAKLTPLSHRALSSPLTFNSTLNKNLSRSYVRPEPHPPSQPPRSNAAGDRIRGAMSQGVWIEAGDRVRKSPEPSPERETMVCVNRQQRREVLHALRKTGKSGQKSPEYNWKSKIHCKKR